MTLEVALMPFVDRVDAGRRLADRLGSGRGDVVVLALPKGGVPVAVEVARALDAPLDVILVRKLGVPAQPELAMGAIGEGGIQIANEDVIRAARITNDQWNAVVDREAAELERRAQRYRGDRQPIPLAGRIAVLIDDGIATGATATAACQVAPPGERHASCSPSRSHRQERSRRSGRPSTRSCAWRRPPRSAPSASGTKTSPRRPMTRSSRPGSPLGADPSRRPG